ncbi:CU044_2847 family protein [Streptomyces diastatochromogenes]|nr:CU044_2847 family protein [Streptomyces diastatochromogenes]MCZ0991104.1 CU044_2847 family protein [Streptomyces diastatochromogenes]
MAEGLVQVARPGQGRGAGVPVLNEMLAGGLSLSAEADVVISRATGQANFKVTLTWHRPGSPDGAAAAAAPLSGDATAP